MSEDRAGSLTAATPRASLAAAAPRRAGPGGAGSGRAGAAPAATPADPRRSRCGSRSRLRRCPCAPNVSPYSATARVNVAIGSRKKSKKLPASQRPGYPRSRRTGGENQSIGARRRFYNNTGPVRPSSLDYAQSGSLRRSGPQVRRTRAFAHHAQKGPRIALWSRRASPAARGRARGGRDRPALTGGRPVPRAPRTGATMSAPIRDLGDDHG